MRAMLNKLPSRGFVRLHRSYIVALNQIQFVRNRLIYIGEKEIPLSITYEPALHSLFGGL